MIYSRSLPAIEGCRYVYWRQMPAVLAPWGLISGHTQTNKNTSPVHPVPVITLYNEFLTVNLNWDRGLVVTHAALYAEGPGFDSSLGKLFFFFVRISYDTVLNIKIFDYDIDSESLTGEDRCVKKEVKRRIAHLFGQHYTHSGTFFPGVLRAISQYCNAYSRPLEAIILCQMIYSRSLPAIEACRYVYWRQMPAVLAQWGVYLLHLRSIANIVTLILAH